MTPTLTDERLASIELDYVMWQDGATNGGIFLTQVHEDFPSLIAAARQRNDLLEALEAARTELDECSLELTGENYNSPKLNALIAKARGETP